MELILKRFANVISIIATALLFFSLGRYFTNGDITEWQLYYKVVAFSYLIVVAFNYIFLGTVTLWHKNVNKKII